MLKKIMTMTAVALFLGAGSASAIGAQAVQIGAARGAIKAAGLPAPSDAQVAAVEAMQAEGVPISKATIAMQAAGVDADEMKDQEAQDVVGMMLKEGVPVNDTTLIMAAVGMSFPQMKNKDLVAAYGALLMIKAEPNRGNLGLALILHNVKLEVNEENLAAADYLVSLRGGAADITVENMDLAKRVMAVPEDDKIIPSEINFTTTVSMDKALSGKGALTQVNLMLFRDLNTIEYNVSKESMDAAAALNKEHIDINKENLDAAVALIVDETSVVRDSIEAKVLQMK